MAVEVVFLTVVMSTASLAQLKGEAWVTANSLFHWQRDWFRQDPHLMATTFMAPCDVRAFGTALEARTTLKRGQDWAVVDAVYGPLEPTPWLSFRGGPGEQTGVWLEGTHPGELKKIRSLLPSWVQGLRTTGKILQAFGKDSNREEAESANRHPSWGGSDLWLFEVIPDTASAEHAPEGQLVALDTRGLDFMTYATSMEAPAYEPGERP